MHHRQPEARAFADAFGGKKRIHRRCQRYRVHALPGIGHAQTDITSRCQGWLWLLKNDFGASADNDFSAIGHRIAGVGCQVEYRQLQLIDVGQDGFGLR
ncbi:hypothetical protein D3C85_590890 [compost metagenome]